MPPSSSVRILFPTLVLTLLISAPALSQAGPKIWDNYDFVPGNKVIFYTDFSEDKVGNFARRLKYVAGSAEVVERDGIKVLRATTPTQFLIPLGRKLPARFTLEFDIIPWTVRCCGYEELSFEGGPTLDRGEKSAAIIWHHTGTMIFGSGMDAGNSPRPFPEEVTNQLMGNVTHVRVLMDTLYFKMYTNEKRNYNIPELYFRRDSVIRVFVTAFDDSTSAVYLTRIRVAESNTGVLYDALATKGRWATQGILFETGKAELQPESRPVLKEIAAALKDHATLKVLIEGHTDNVGVPATNLALSSARAAAVKSALVEQFGIVADRIATKGWGSTKPAALNTTAEGRAQNRRVEVVKQP
jgi:outer membrane protein OmpA-like peptidoglycan-associated protein